MYKKTTKPQAAKAKFGNKVANSALEVTIQQAAVNFISSMINFPWQVKRDLDINNLVNELFAIDRITADSDEAFVGEVLDKVFPGEHDISIQSIKYNLDKFRKSNDYLLTSKKENPWAAKGKEFCDIADNLLNG